MVCMAGWCCAADKDDRIKFSMIIANDEGTSACFVDERAVYFMSDSAIMLVKRSAHDEDSSGMIVVLQSLTRMTAGYLVLRCRQREDACLFDVHRKHRH